MHHLQVLRKQLQQLIGYYGLVVGKALDLTLSHWRPELIAGVVLALCHFALLPAYARFVGKDAAFSEIGPIWLTLSAAVLGLLTILAFMMVLAPFAIHRQQQQLIHELTRGIPTAEILRSRNREISRINPPHDDIEALERAARRAVDNQIRVVKTLRLKDSGWQFPPIGWSEDIPELMAWAGIAHVMSERYPERISSPLVLYDRFNRTGEPIIALDNFEASKEYTMNVIALLILELEHPYAQRRRLAESSESPETFLEVVKFYRQRQLASQVIEAAAKNSANTARSPEKNLMK